MYDYVRSHKKHIRFLNDRDLIVAADFAWNKHSILYIRLLFSRPLFPYTSTPPFLHHSCFKMRFPNLSRSDSFAPHPGCHYVKFCSQLSSASPLKFW